MPVLLGMMAQTRIVTKTPARIKNKPILVIVGNPRFMNMTTKADIQVTVKYTMKTCHRSYAYPSWKRPYMDMIWLARMEDMDAVPNSQPRKFHLLTAVWLAKLLYMYNVRIDGGLKCDDALCCQGQRTSQQRIQLLCHILRLPSHLPSDIHPTPMGWLRPFRQCRPQS